MNFFEATVRRQGAPAVEVPGLGCLRLSGQDEGRPDGAAVTMAMRPESLTIPNVPTGLGGVAGVLQARQHLGGRQMLHAAITGRAAPVAAAIQGAGDDAASNLRPGQPVRLSWKDDAVLVLDA